MKITVGYIPPVSLLSGRGFSPGGVIPVVGLANSSLIFRAHQ
ncbi:hypothetical protein P9272_03615 [Mesorhizobium sp. WSM4976]|nr:hypothetical protein [Mesorhizobium sp. WSM4976]MDG4892677.1 hypothetical protein [Mesorhizobium sp. WSM4976]